MSSPKTTTPYENISYDDLFIYAVWDLKQTNKNPDWPDIVVHTHRLFPMRFGLPHYEEKYPDSAQVDRSLLRCRDKGFLKGGRGKGYSVTGAGLHTVNTVGKKLARPSDTKSIKTAMVHAKSRAGKIISHVKKCSAYKKYCSKKHDEISEYDVCAMLFCTLDATSETKIKNLNHYKEEAMAGKWKEVIEFLDWIENQFPSLFHVNVKHRKGIFG